MLQDYPLSLHRGRPLEKGAPLIDVYERALDKGVHVSRRGENRLERGENRRPLEFEHHGPDGSKSKAKRTKPSR